MDSEETREEMIRRIARNRYDFRQHFKWRLNENSTDDWRYAEDEVRKIEIQNANATLDV